MVVVWTKTGLAKLLLDVSKLGDTSDRCTKKKKKASFCIS